MEKINELTVAKVTKLDGKSWKKSLFIITSILILIGAGVLIWGFGFHGFLYKELQNKTKNLYLNIFVNQNEKIDEKNFTNEGFLKYQKALENLDQYFKEIEENEPLIYTPVVKVESLKTNNINNMIFAVTDLSFKDKRDHITDDDKLSNTIFFKFTKNKQVFNILYLVGEIKKEIEG